VRRSFPSLALTALLLAGCAIGPDYKRPPVAVPGAFRGQSPDDVPTAAEATSLGDLQWWEVFQDPELRGLIGRALASNFDLSIAVGRVLEARAQVGIARADQFPQVSGSVSGKSFRVSRNAFPMIPPPGTVREDDFQMAGNFSFEIDLWGKLRRATEAARAHSWPPRRRGPR